MKTSSLPAAVKDRAFSFDTQHTPRFILSTTVGLFQLLSFIFRYNTRNIISLRTKRVCKISEVHIIQGVPLATEPDISLIILTPMKILQRNLNRITFVV